MDQICIDFTAENGRKLPVAAAKARCNALSAITECYPSLFFMASKDEMKCSTITNELYHHTGGKHLESHSVSYYIQRR